MGQQRLHVVPAFSLERFQQKGQKSDVFGHFIAWFPAFIPVIGVIFHRKLTSYFCPNSIPYPAEKVTGLGEKTIDFSALPC
jgi:hypothetical protein